MSYELSEKHHRAFEPGTTIQLLHFSDEETLPITRNAYSYRSNSVSGILTSLRLGSLAGRLFAALTLRASLRLLPPLHSGSYSSLVEMQKSGSY